MHRIMYETELALDGAHTYYEAPCSACRDRKLTPDAGVTQRLVSIRTETGMPGFKLTFCRRCGQRSAHDIYISKGGYLHSLCTDCGKDADSSARCAEITGEATKECGKCGTNTEHLRYISEGGYIHWFCCSCGKDVDSSARGR